MSALIERTAIGGSSIICFATDDFHARHDEGGRIDWREVPRCSYQLVAVTVQNGLGAKCRLIISRRATRQAEALHVLCRTALLRPAAAAAAADAVVGVAVREEPEDAARGLRIVGKGAGEEDVSAIESDSSSLDDCSVCMEEKT